ncbi:hypothetical protein SOVF_023520 [Spinacia oleracea]|nr:hypothetical protein SOVF_023520 [Spinacia oleracea]
MGALPMPFEALPLGFRFKPTDVELIDHYLRLKINGKDDEVACIKEVDICRVEPWDLPDLSAIRTLDPEWFFFCPRDRKYPNGQRSNRATEAGYWKATGKDRSIKSRKMGLIGMKKTLVFYTGRAPKGQRTNWVIHEYRPMIQELDGTHPGQVAFVLCRLFKKAEDLKPDDNEDGYHTEEVETNIYSPTPTNVSQKDVRSEPMPRKISEYRLDDGSPEDLRSEPAVVQASPVSVEQSVEQQMTSETFVVKPCDSITSKPVLPDHPRVNKEVVHEVDSYFNEPFNFYDAPDSYYPWQSMHTNQGPIGMDDIFPSEIGDSHNGLHLQDINGKEQISDFMDSVIDPDAPYYKEAVHQGETYIENDVWKNSSIKESGSCSGSDVEVAQQKHDVGFIRQNYNEPKGYEELLQSCLLADDENIFSDDAVDRFINPLSSYPPTLGTGSVKVEDGNQIVGNSGIKIRSNLRGRELPSSTFAGQGTANRRMRLQKFQDEEEEESNFTVTERSCSPTIAPHEDFICLTDLVDNATTAADEIGVVETGIKIRTNLQRTRPSAAKSVEQGTANRRIRLQKRFTSAAEAEVCKTSVAEIRNSSVEVREKQCADNSEGRPDKNDSKLKKSTPVHMVIKVVVVVFLFMACFGLWIARSVILLSS